MTARQKIEQFAAQMLEAQAGDMLTRSLMTFAPQLLKRLPDDPEILDQHLYEWAAVMIMLRGDDARPIELRFADTGEPVHPSVDADADVAQDRIVLGPGEHYEYTPEPSS